MRIQITSEIEIPRLGELIERERRLLKVHGVTLQQLASVAGITPQQWRRIELEQGAVPSDTLQRIAVALNSQSLLSLIDDIL